jgi:hypothetical protein
MEEEGEGCVAYFVLENSSHQRWTASMAKIKNSEYWIYRGLREALKNSYNNTEKSKYEAIYR